MSSMMAADASATRNDLVYRYSTPALALLGVLAALLYLIFRQAVDFMVGQWNMEEFSHGYLIPFISGYFIWQRRAALERSKFYGSWAGTGVVLFGLATDVMGRLSALYVVQHFALLLVVAGLVLALGGWVVLRGLALPLGILVFMVPLPNILLNTLSAQLQLISSSVGVSLIRFAGVPVLLEGNVIDLGSYRLEVAQACSGLRYLLPLMTLGFLVACIFRAPLWKRSIVFVSSIPITLLMNSLRIAIIGVTVNLWGIGMAEGVLHEVQGWMMFMASTAVLVLEVMLLSGVGRAPVPWRKALRLEMSATQTRGSIRCQRALPLPILACTAILATFAIGTLAIPAPKSMVPPRESFATFPLRLGEWVGRREGMDAVYLDTLKLDDYLLASYVRGEQARVDVYVAWYDAQSTGESTHSPKACLPGGGWRIDDLKQIKVPGVRAADQPLRVNRALIANGEQRELVYYWFQQRGRVITNEYLVKWYLLIDALQRHRTDGALVRLIVPLTAGESAEHADGVLRGFAAILTPQLRHFVPE